MALSDLVHAVLVLHDPPTSEGAGPGPERARLPLQFNPETISLGKSVGLSRDSLPAAPHGGAAQFQGAGPRTLGLEVFLDASFPGDKPVEKQVETLLQCCEPTEKSISAKRPAPPWVRLEWGQARTTCFTAWVTSLSVEYTRFGRDGTPLRATCQLSLEETGGRTARQNPTSGAYGVARWHRLVTGDRLPVLAADQYGDAAAWRAIAQANAIDDPARLAPGTLIELPLLDEWDAVLGGGIRG
ncbi:hypothetical protein [Streptomyces yunnanensis]|uniref:LysM domain-containing protein n=1 Tax=Streptomyces yunnanensis TaxID=156453 RepID=A0A9X8N9U2_9ACTN|nr:hypothetical protein [Streptomyces yunnanensis]SHN35758.1 hypothetical protein SAMN05216268_1612 [Streptomyces yunnanensis]